MAAPTEPGQYWWRPCATAQWTIVEVCQFSDGNWIDPSLVAIGLNRGEMWACAVDHLEKSTAQWGPRIPEPPPNWTDETLHYGETAPRSNAND